MYVGNEFLLRTSWQYEMTEIRDIIHIMKTRGHFMNIKMILWNSRVVHIYPFFMRCVLLFRARN